MTQRHVWVFSGDCGRFPGGIFTDEAVAVAWIRANKLTGVLTQCPLDEGCMDWAVRTRRFDVERPNNLAKSRDPSFIGSFSTAAQEHSHWQDGRTGDDDSEHGAG